MRRVVFALVAAMVAGAVVAQENPAYSPGENPYQGDFPFTLGQPVGLHVDIQGVRLDSLTVTALGEVRPGEKVKCEAVLAGNNTSERKASLTTVLLLEDADGKALERVSLESFKAKSKREFQERQKVAVAGEALAAARKVYLFVQLAF